MVGEGSKSLEMQLQLPLWRRKLVLLLSPPTVLGCNIKVEECRAGAATHYAAVPIRALLSLGPSLLLNCAYLHAGAPCSYLGSPFPLDALPFSHSHFCLLLSGLLCLPPVSPFANSGLLFSHFMLGAFSGAVSPLEGLIPKSSLTLQHPAPEALAQL